MSTARMYFIALVAPEDINRQALKWKHYMRDHYGCTVALRSPAHITLIPPFWMNELQEDELLRDVGAFANEHSPLEIRLKNFDAFKPRVIFAHVEVSDQLRQMKLSLEKFLAEKNRYPFKKETRPFHPHLTIANRDLRKKDFHAAFEHFSKIDYETSFAVTGISILKHTGDQWSVRHNLPLNQKTPPLI